MVTTEFRFSYFSTEYYTKVEFTLNCNYDTLEEAREDAQHVVDTTYITAHDCMLGTWRYQYFFITDQ